MTNMVANLPLGAPKTSKHFELTIGGCLRYKFGVVPIHQHAMAAMLGVVALVLSFTAVLAADPDPLQDFCVAVPKATINVPIAAPSYKKSEYQEDPTKVKDVTMTTTPNATEIATVTVNVNGAICKDANDVKAEDFHFKQLVNVGDTKNMLGSKVTAANVGMFFGLNTLGISFARIDFAGKGVNPPHVHPRATEIFLVIEGTFKVGFVDTTNKLFSVTMYKGELFVFPRGLVHFQENLGYEPGLAFAALSSQNPGTQQIAPAVFGADPPISDEVLKKSFGLDQHTVDSLQGMFGKANQKTWSTEAS